MLCNALNSHGVFGVVKFKVVNVLNIEQADKFLNLFENLGLLGLKELSSEDQIHDVGISSLFGFHTSMKAIEDVLLVFTPEVSILMPVSSFLLRILECSIKLNVADSGDLFVFLILIVEAEEFWEFDDLIPYSLGKLDHLLFIKVNIFDKDTTVIVEGIHDSFFIGDEILQLSGREDKWEANLSFWGLNFIHWGCYLHLCGINDERGLN